MEQAFLSRFARGSPLPVPDPVYVEEDFTGYRKIVGVPFTAELLCALPVQVRHETARTATLAAFDQFLAMQYR